MKKERAAVKAKQYREWASKAEEKAGELYERYLDFARSFDWTEPIKMGHHSQRRHERMFEKRDAMRHKILELDKKAKRFREKADNLEAFANRNKGEAERKREKERNTNREWLEVGMQVQTWVYGIAKVVKINTKTARVEKEDGWQTNVPIHFLERLK